MLLLSVLSCVYLGSYNELRMQLSAIALTVRKLNIGNVDVIVAIVFRFTRPGRASPAAAGYHRVRALFIFDPH